jgi:hypothetical protein
MSLTPWTQGFPTVDLVMGIQKLLRFATQGATQWYVDMNQASLRNAMAASTALAQRRLEYVEVEEFLALHQRRLEARKRVRMQRIA